MTKLKNFRILNSFRQYKFKVTIQAPENQLEKFILPDQFQHGIMTIELQAFNLRLATLEALEFCELNFITPESITISIL